MKHTHEIIGEKLGLFGSPFGKPEEKGALEWSTFNIVKDDTAGAYRVRTPHVAREPRYPNSVPIHRHRKPRHLITHPLILGTH